MSYCTTPPLTHPRPRFSAAPPSTPPPPHTTAKQLPAPYIPKQPKDGGDTCNFAPMQVGRRRARHGLLLRTRAACVHEPAARPCNPPCAVLCIIGLLLSRTVFPLVWRRPTAAPPDRPPRLHWVRIS